MDMRPSLTVPYDQMIANSFASLAKGGWTPVCTGRPLTVPMKGDDMFAKDHLGKRNSLL